MSRRYVEVALPPPLARELTYLVPPDLGATAAIGALVLVPVGKRLMTGVIVAESAPTAAEVRVDPSAIRPVAQILAGEALLDPDVIDLCRWMAAYYFAPLASALLAALPPGLQVSSRRQVQLGAAPEPAGALEKELVARLADGPLTVSTLKRRLSAGGTDTTALERALDRLRRSHSVDVRPVLPAAAVGTVRNRLLRVVPTALANGPLEQLHHRAPRQAACLEHLVEHGPTPKKKLAASGFAYPVQRQLLQRGLIEEIEQERVRDPLAHITLESGPELELTADQRSVIAPIVAAIEAGRFYPALLHGVTGSGKTLVYIEAVTQALEQGRSALILVPEIALAWQMVRRFRSRFGTEVAVMHSQLSAGERFDTWRRLRRGEQRVVIGARSAILAPLPQLGLIVVDEEHDASYKQEDLEGRHPLLYNARDLALVRGQRRQAVVLLGAATPSLESYENARAGKYHLLALPRRIDNRPLPRVEVVDMRLEPYQRRQRALFSHALRMKLQQRLERGEKVILLQNRRGFAPTVVCSSCGEACECNSCRVALTCHRRGQTTQLRCHYCDHRESMATSCSRCGSAELQLEGVGTQKVEEELNGQFPGIRVIRMDVDTTGWKGAHDELVERFRHGEADVLLGTQMVAKGLDFPEVTLVGVISADTGMHLPDFRAAERSFQLITQVAGRAGRGEIGGEVVIQTRLPESPVLQAAAEQDYAAFAGLERSEREMAAFPPFGRLIALRWRGRAEERVEEAALACADRLRADGGDLLGPAPAPLAKLKGFYRWQALLRGTSIQRLQAIVARSLEPMATISQGADVALTVNVDPLTLM